MEGAKVWPLGPREKTQKAQKAQEAQDAQGSARASAPEAADEVLEGLEGRGQQEVGGQQAAEAGDRRVQPRIHIGRLLLALQALVHRPEQGLAVRLEPRVQAAELLEACRVFWAGR